MSLMCVPEQWPQSGTHYGSFHRNSGVRSHPIGRTSTDGEGYNFDAQTEMCVFQTDRTRKYSGGACLVIETSSRGVSSMSAVIHRPDTLNHGDQITCTSLHLTYVNELYMISQDASDEMEVDSLPRPAMFPAKFPGTPHKLSIGGGSSHIPMLHK